MSHELDATAALARRFAIEVVRPLVGVEGRDGSLEQLDDVLARADELGLMAHAYDDGQPAALAILEELAAECAGVAASVLFAALGAFELGAFELGAIELGRAGDAGGRAAVAPELPWGPATLALRQDEAGWRLAGERPFVYAAPDTKAFVIAAGERRAVVPVAARGLSVEQHDERMGLAACRVCSLRFNELEVEPRWWIDRPAPGNPAVRLWLGLAAVAVGNARGAVNSARRYAADRYQGGKRIASHPAVQLLLGGAEARVMTSRAALQHVARLDDPPVREAAMLKVRVLGDAADAVSDALQVLGGYGYMEDYRLEKRLRDALTLKGMAGRPGDLLCGVAASAEAAP